MTKFYSSTLSEGKASNIRPSCTAVSSCARRLSVGRRLGEPTGKRSHSPITEPNRAGGSARLLVNGQPGVATFCTLRIVLTLISSFITLPYCSPDSRRRHRRWRPPRPPRRDHASRQRHRRQRHPRSSRRVYVKGMFHFIPFLNSLSNHVNHEPFGIFVLP